MRYPSLFQSTPAPDQASLTAIDTMLEGAGLLMARVGWLVIVLPALVMYIIALPLRYGQLYVATNANALLSALSLMLEIFCMAAFFGVAAILFWKRSRNWMALLSGLFLVTFGVTFPTTLNLLANRSIAIAIFTDIIGALAYITLSGIGFFFPSGQCVPRWGWGFLLLTTILQVPFSAPASSPLSSLHWPPVLFLGAVLSVFLPPIVAQVYRYRRISNHVQRQQTKWLVYGVSISLLLALTLRFLISFRPNYGSTSYFNAVASDPVLAPVFMIILLAIPLSFGVAILLYRLWDIDWLINRTLVYGLLTGCIASIYALIISALSALFQSHSSFLSSLVATGIVVVCFQPLRERLQHGVNHLLYGETGDPYAVLTRLGTRLEATLTPEASLPVIVETIAQALKLPYAAITLQHGTEVTLAAMHGTAVPAPMALTLRYQGEVQGELLLAPRALGESFSPGDMALLREVARQAGMVVRAARLSTELQNARERLVMTREEERRRLRRDLHDGLGPQLASQTLTLAAAARLLHRDPDTAERLLQDAIRHAEVAITDIRRLVYALRPPALDDLGLIGALQEQLTNTKQEGLRISLMVRGDLPLLTAAIEVACYRIVQEAVTNVVRHARAHICTVTLSVKHGLEVEVCDDGIGFPQPFRAGVGIISMRERAEELGGTYTVLSPPQGGTAIRVWLPLERGV